MSLMSLVPRGLYLIPCEIRFGQEEAGEIDRE